jgi:hypothetical protein
LIFARRAQLHRGKPNRAEQICFKKISSVHAE